MVLGAYVIGHYTFPHQMPRVRIFASIWPSTYQHWRGSRVERARMSMWRVLLKKIKEHQWKNLDTVWTVLSSLWLKRRVGFTDLLKRTWDFCIKYVLPFHPRSLTFSPLKNGGWKTKFLLGFGNLFRGRAVELREGTCSSNSWVHPAIWHKLNQSFSHSVLILCLKKYQYQRAVSGFFFNHSKARQWNPALEEMHHQPPRGHYVWYICTHSCHVHHMDSGQRWWIQFCSSPKC